METEILVSTIRRLIDYWLLMLSDIPSRGPGARILAGVALIVLATGQAAAHPGSGLVVSPSGEVFFAHGNTLVRVDRAGNPTVLARDNGGERFYQLHHLFLDRKGAVHTASDSGTGIWKATVDGSWSRHYPASGRNACLQVGLGGDPFAMDADGNIYSVNQVRGITSQIMRITPSGRIDVMAGGDWGYRDGVGSQARFGDLHGSSMIVAPDGSLLLTDDGRYVRRITPDGTVTTLAGAPRQGTADEKNDSFRFGFLRGIALNSAGRVHVADAGGRSRKGGRIYKVGPAGKVEMVAGGGESGLMEGPGLQVELTEPTGLAFGPEGGLYFLEPLFPRIRKLSPGGEVTWVLKSLAPNP